MKFVQDFFATDSFIPSLNNTFIALIPKKEDACQFDHFRPINLCNFAYKVLSKLLANRLRPILKKIVSPLQKAFVPGRWIAEITILAQELIHIIKKKKGKRKIENCKFK